MNADRQLLADLVWAEYRHDEQLHPYIPHPSIPTVVADDVAAWLDAQVGATSATMQAAERFSGPLAMAPAMYPVFWVEAACPPGYRLGQLVVTDEILADPLESGRLSVRTFGFIHNRHGVQPPYLGLCWTQAADGTVEAFKGALHDEDIRWTVAFTPWTPNDMVDEMVAAEGIARIDSQRRPDATMAVCHAEQVIAACAFAICRNLRVEPVAVPERVARKRARKLGIDEPRVSRLRLPGYQSWRSKAQVAAGAGAQQLPMSLVRAHPKTYRRNPDGTGGLGKHHAEGTWLWQPFVRGSKEAGERIARVTVSPPEEQP